MPTISSNKSLFYTVDYNHTFNGKEKDDEVYGSGNFQDYGMRMYDTRIARFASADPLIVKEQQYPELSAYQFASNTPIRSIDLDGLEEFVRIDYYSGRNLYKSQIRMVSNYKAEQNIQTVHHVRVDVGNNGTSTSSYLGTTQGTTTGVNAFFGPNDNANSTIGTKMRRDIFGLDANNQRQRFTFNPPRQMRAEDPVTGVRTNVTASGWEYHANSSNMKKVGFSRAIFVGGAFRGYEVDRHDDIKTWKTLSSKQYDATYDSQMYNGTTPTQDVSLPPESKVPDNILPVYEYQRNLIDRNGVPSNGETGQAGTRFNDNGNGN